MSAQGSKTPLLSKEEIASLIHGWLTEFGPLSERQLELMYHAYTEGMVFANIEILRRSGDLTVTRGPDGEQICSLTPSGLARAEAAAWRAS